MRRRHAYLFAMALIASSIAILAASIAIGDGQLGLFLIFPFLIASGPIATAGIVLLICGVLALLLGFSISEEGEPRAPVMETKRETGGVIMLGPIPIAFGSNERIARKMLWLGIGLFIVMMVVALALSFVF